LQFYIFVCPEAAKIYGHYTDFHKLLHIVVRIHAKAVLWTKALQNKKNKKNQKYKQNMYLLSSLSTKHFNY